MREAARVPVPGGLAERILLRRRRAPSKWLRGLAAAAVLVLGLGLGLLYQLDRASEALARNMIVHVLGEPEVYGMGEEVAPARVMAALATVGSNPQGTIGRVTFLDNCKGLDPGGTHMLVHTAFGRAAVLLLPNIQRRRPARLSEHGMSAALVPAPHGVIAIVAESPETVARIESHLQRTLRLRT